MIAESGLSALPAGLGAATQLRMLDVAHNELEAPPAAALALRRRGCFVLW